jgi:hypothetical protein
VSDNSYKLGSSFRDPSGFMFKRQDGTLLRQVNKSYSKDYDALMESGLYKDLVKKGWLIPHEEQDISMAVSDLAYKIIKPTEVSFISYPYEWSFSQLKDAALLTLEIALKAMDYEMILKDASSFNVQFHEGRPVFIDTLSFAQYEEGNPWIGYKQFCQHFLAPLALMSYCDTRMSQLMTTNIDGIPLDLASKLLPKKSKLRPGIMMHLHLHAASQQKGGDTKKGSGKQLKFSKMQFRAILESLKSAVSKLNWDPKGTVWYDYYEKTNYSEVAASHKAQIVTDYIDTASPQEVWDWGGNIGNFSRLASNKGIKTLCLDIDLAAVEINYLQVKKAKEKNLLPLFSDLTNPTPSIGWDLDERDSIKQRAKPDLSMALALIHHLAIGNNLPLEKVADYFSQISPWLIIEFVSKEDSQVQRMLSFREDIFDDYTKPGFEKAFAGKFEIIEQRSVESSDRTIYLMKRKDR